MKTESLIAEAIEKKMIISFSYDGYSRRVEPHHYGLLHDVKHLHAYQISNGSKTGHLPQWRNFKLDEISNLILDPKSRFKIRKSFNPLNAHYTSIIKSVNS